MMAPGGDSKLLDSEELKRQAAKKEKKALRSQAKRDRKANAARATKWVDPQQKAADKAKEAEKRGKKDEKRFHRMLKRADKLEEQAKKLMAEAQRARARHAAMAEQRLVSPANMIPVGTLEDKC